MILLSDHITHNQKTEKKSDKVERVGIIYAKEKHTQTNKKRNVKFTMGLYGK